MLKSIRNSLILLFLTIVSFDTEAKTQVVDSFSLTNIPKYDANFTHFAYVNSKAPKGGKITLPAYGSFDSFNPFIFKGIAFPEGADLSL